MRESAAGVGDHAFAVSSKHDSQLLQVGADSERDRELDAERAEPSHVRRAEVACDNRFRRRRRICQRGVDAVGEPEQGGRCQQRRSLRDLLEQQVGLRPRRQQNRSASLIAVCGGDLLQQVRNVGERDDRGRLLRQW